VTGRAVRTALALSFFLLASRARPADVPAGVPPAGILVRYSFDDELIETGPDTFHVFANSKGTVRLSHAYRWSGDSSVELRDVAGDGDFPELQGYFPAIAKGTLYAHFALLTTTPLEEFNVALAGPAGFRLARNGIAFWLRAREGFLLHTSDSIPKRLFALEPFTWYFVDVTYRVETGSYDLAIRQEGDRRPRVLLENQPNAARQPGSIVNTFSFVGDIEDDVSEVVYYVDDVVIGTDQRIPMLPFAAPGRRRLFVDRLLRDGSLLKGRPACLPFSEPGDLGLDASDVATLKNAGVLERLEALALGQRPSPRARPDGLSGRPADLLEAAGEWREGCEALASRDPARALTHFESASSRSRGRIYRLSQALALAALGRFVEADELLGASSAEWVGDPRYTLALAIVGAARGDLARAEQVLRPPAEELLAESAALPGVGEPKRSCEALETRMLAEEYFVALLVNGFADAAAGYADRMIERLEKSGRSVAEWLERRGDAAFAAGDWSTAIRLYERSAQASPRALLKLADVYLKLGDLTKEKALRERIYGSLEAP
jgi:tetratricopeptide (TPR) repeat protein